MAGRDPASPSDRRKNPSRKKTDRRQAGPDEPAGAKGHKESGSGDPGKDPFSGADEE
jgi:hypothetical protein